MFDYLIVARKLVKGAFTANAGDVCFVKVPRDADIYTKDHVIPRVAWMREVQGLSDGDQNPNSISPTGDVLVFVHGYDNTIGNVLTRMRQLRANLTAQGWHGEVVSFDWPSHDQTLAYLEDRALAARVAIDLVDDGLLPLMKSQQAGCITNVHVIAHSTGAYVVMEAFAQAQKIEALFKSDWRIGQVAFISGDVASGSLATNSDWATPMYGRIMRLTNYANGFDAVLAVSNAKRLGTAPRAGRVGLPADIPDKAVNVDCSAYFHVLPVNPDAIGTWTHSWQFTDMTFALDLALTLEGAIDRRAIPTRALDGPSLSLREGARPAYQAAAPIKPQLEAVRALGPSPAVNL